MVSVASMEGLMSAAPMLKEIFFTNAKSGVQVSREVMLGECWIRFNPTCSSSKSTIEEKIAVLPVSIPKVFSQETLDTQSKEPTHGFTEYFPGINPGLYRLTVWRPQLDSLKGPEKFNPEDFKPIPLVRPDYSEQKEYACHCAIKKTQYKEGTDIILPSLDAEERLFNLRAFDENQRVINPAKLKLEYSDSTQFYRLILPTSGNFTIQ